MPITDFQKEYLESLHKEEEEMLLRHTEQINLFKAFLVYKGVNVDHVKFKYYPTSGIIATYPGLIRYLHENLINDKEGLLRFDDLTKTFNLKHFMNGYLYAENFMLMAHPYFRRGFHQINHFAPRFIDLYWRLKDNNIDKYISQDYDSVRISLDKYGYMELDTWYGAKFEKQIADVPDGIVKIRPPGDLKASHVSFFFAHAYSLDIKWSTKNGVKTFQAEEFKTDNVTIIKDGEECFPVRYIHAEFDLEKGYFRHFDGAIHFYTLDEYFARRDSDFNYNAKNSSHIKTLSQKLFKVNGIINKEIWLELTSHFFTGNPLVFEYFEGSYPVHILELFEKVRKLKTDE